jgi:LmbE family N-acetylglucosaminyl deacetylase
VVREVTVPQGLVAVRARDDVSLLEARLSAAGYQPIELPSEDGPELADVGGPLAAVLVDADLLDSPTVAHLTLLRSAHPHARVAVLAGEHTSARGLLTAMRAGLTQILDPHDPEAAATLFPDGPVVRPRVLAIGAHPDDVEIGCGATLLRHRDLGHPISVLTLSQGAVGGTQDERRQEARDAASQLGAELFLADLPDTRIGHEPRLIKVIEAVIAAILPTTVYVHTGADNHQDHRAVHEATLVAARRVPRLLCYQSPSSRTSFAPSRFVPVDDTVQEKVQLLGHYRSQSSRHYLEPDLVLAICRYWGRQLTHTRYVEPFEVVRAAGGED